MKIVKLSASNVKRIHAVEITPDPGGSMVVIGGDNAQGKSSVLDSIMYALGGAGTHPTKPVRTGSKKARVVLDLGDLVVTRTFTAYGGSTLEVKDAKGEKLKSPQAILDALCAKVAFDPLEYSRMKPAEQAEVLRGLVNLDTSAVDAEHKRACERRTDLGRQYKQVAGHLAEMPPVDGAPLAEVSVAELAAELQRANKLKGDNDATRRLVGTAEHKLISAKNDLSLAEHEADTIRVELDKLNEELSSTMMRIAVHEATVVESNKALDAARTTAAALVDTDTSAIMAAMAGADEANRIYRSEKARKETIASMVRIEADGRKAKEQIEECEEKLRAIIAAASFPVPGLSFSETGGVLLGGLPLEQASSAEQLRVSVAIGLASNPKLKVLLVRDGSLLDDSSLAMIAQLAAESGGQLWVERVGHGAECSVVIEDGSVVGAAAEAESAS